MLTGSGEQGCRPDRGADLDDCRHLCRPGLPRRLARTSAKDIVLGSYVSSFYLFSILSSVFLWTIGSSGPGQGLTSLEDPSRDYTLL